MELDDPRGGHLGRAEFHLGRLSSCATFVEMELDGPRGALPVGLVIPAKAGIHLGRVITDS
ncbi:MAG: hypothetical protein COA41_12170 [Sphingopyxis sp.]|nr:MAG: hypothetical protein COA41_12170 [Sphingopyxis sp.]